MLAHRCSYCLYQSNCVILVAIVQFNELACNRIRLYAYNRLQTPRYMFLGCTSNLRALPSYTSFIYVVCYSLYNGWCIAVGCDHAVAVCSAICIVFY